MTLQNKQQPPQLHVLETEKWISLIKPEVHKQLWTAVNQTNIPVGMGAQKPRTIVGEVVEKLIGYSAFYTSDQIPAAYKRNQVCWGLLASIEPKQTNLLLVIPFAKLEFALTIKSFVPFIKKCFDNTFVEGYSMEKAIEFTKCFGFIIPPNVTATEPMAKLAAILINSRSLGMYIDKGSTYNQLFNLMFRKGWSNGSFSANVPGAHMSTAPVYNKEAVSNYVEGSLNSSFANLPSMQDDPDYYSYQNCANCVFSDFEISKTGPYHRPSDLYWPENLRANTTAVVAIPFELPKGSITQSDAEEFLNKMLEELGYDVQELKEDAVT